MNLKYARQVLEFSEHLGKLAGELSAAEKSVGCLRRADKCQAPHLSDRAELHRPPLRHDGEAYRLGSCRQL
jgi:hypothetical protein